MHLYITESHVFEIGYWVGKRYWGKGYAQKAVPLFVRHLFLSFPSLTRIQAFTKSGNLTSQRVLEKSGFTEEGTLREYIKKKDTYHDAKIYGVLRSEVLL
jgi:ribosomal-protein-alanine N-acetyltransferase